MHWQRDWKFLTVASEQCYTATLGNATGHLNAVFTFVFIVYL
ncbi:Uncharacterized protein APZ42_009736 [Daphnia magna]|uniref:Uncharacterized protein n=1 Tax=Daphnia magna TaxID=35525 RepID=A0A162BQD2_9CRUS|nr:Uncharacterized protein APZ42_009736 [Daphnia magna]